MQLSRLYRILLFFSKLWHIRYKCGILNIPFGLSRREETPGLNNRGKDKFMLNEEKIRWMTRASIYEKRQGHTDLERNEYFLGDYVRLHLMKNMIGVTVAYILMVGLYAVCKIEDIFALAANMQLMVFLKEVLLVYLILALIYTGIGIIYYAWQYQSSHKQLKKYYRILRHIDQCGEKNSRSQEDKR